MTMNYQVMYSSEALDDLREIYLYIKNELLAPKTAVSQIKRIKKSIMSLSFMPERLISFEKLLYLI